VGSLADGVLAAGVLAAGVPQAASKATVSIRHRVSRNVFFISSPPFFGTQPGFIIVFIIVSRPLSHNDTKLQKMYPFIQLTRYICSEGRQDDIIPFVLAP
jgi:hypothetical protein